MTLKKESYGLRSKLINEKHYLLNFRINNLLNENNKHEYLDYSSTLRRLIIILITIYIAKIFHIERWGQINY